MAIHPSGKLALTTSKDNTIKMWNLVHGRCAFTRRLKAAGDRIKWDTTNDACAHYLVVSGGMNLQVFAAADNAVAFEVALKSRINQAVFTSVKAGSTLETRVAVVCENKNLYLYKLDGTEVFVVSMHVLYRTHGVVCRLSN
jgi:WD40 repeat protein